MKPTEIIAALRTSRRLPTAALRAATQRADAIAPAVIAVVEKAAAGVHLLPDEQRLLLRGVHVLAAARESSLWQPLLRLVRLPRTKLDTLLDDGLTESLASIMIAVYDGDAASLTAAISDRVIDGFVRWALFGVLARATFVGSEPRAAAHDLLDRFERDNLADAGDAAWEGWQDAVRLLGFEDLAPRVHATWADGRNPQAVPDQQDWNDEFQAAIANPGDAQRFVDDRLVPLDDPVAALKWSENDGPDTAKYPGTDPAARIALDQDEVDWLDGFLRQAGGNAMTVEELDGFMTALVLGPDLVPPSKYLPEIWGSEGPVYDSKVQAEYVLNLTMRHWNTIARRLDDKSPHLPLMSDAELTGRAWANAFMRGVAMRMDLWDRRLPKDEALTTFLGHVLVLTASNEVAAEEGITPEQRAKMLSNLPLAILGMHLYWRENPIAAPGAVRPAQAGRAKVGRNDPCPCGSGKKFKKCCGGPASTVH